MDNTNSPTSFGGFKPAGQTVIAFRCDEDMEHALQSLRRSSFPETSLTQCTPDEMITQVAPLGFDLTISATHRVLAHEGCSFLIVDAPKTEQAEHVALVAKACNAAAAQHYGHVITEALAG